jgi:hypothetical protein
MLKLKRRLEMADKDFVIENGLLAKYMWKAFYIADADEVSACSAVCPMVFL